MTGDVFIRVAEGAQAFHFIRPWVLLAVDGISCFFV